MIKHTPGPWGFSKDDRYISDQFGEPIVALCNQLDSPESDANKFLIAAAPDMLAALHRAECFMQTLYKHAYGEAGDVRFDIDYQTVFSAIDKAEGRE